MDAKGFSLDLSSKPQTFLNVVEQTFDWTPVIDKKAVVIGMGSSHFAASSIAYWMNSSNSYFVPTLASVRDLSHLNSDNVVIAISATGNSAETLAALSKVPPNVTKIALTNDPQSRIVGLVDHVIELHAGTESGGVASLTYLATLVALLRLVEKQKQSEILTPHISHVHEALAHIYDTRYSWLEEIDRLSIGPHGTYCVAPLERLCSAQQSALMLREGPRLMAQACEVADWSHIDVYLTKTLDYRMIIFPGSDWEQELFEWTVQRQSTVVTIGANQPHAQLSLRYPHDNHEIVRLLAEISYVELLAANRWLHS